MKRLIPFSFAKHPARTTGERRLIMRARDLGSGRIVALIPRCQLLISNLFATMAAAGRQLDRTSVARAPMYDVYR